MLEMPLDRRWRLTVYERMDVHMMPLTFANVGEEYVIKRVGGSPEVKKHLEDLGFVVGGAVSIVATIGGNLILNVKDSRVAVSRELVQKIMV